MNRGWKRLAERADQEAYAPGEVRDALPAALEQDWEAEVPAAVLAQVRNVLGDQQPSLMGDDRLDRLEALRTAAAGFAFCGVVLDCAAQAVSEGYCGDDAMKKAATDALVDRAARCARQVEEHYLRKSNGRRAVHVRERIEDSVNRSALNVIAGQLLGLSASTVDFEIKQKSGVDDGVEL